METKKTLPIFTSDEDAEKFVAMADLSDYDLSGFTPVTFEFARRIGDGSAEPPTPATRDTSLESERPE